MKSALSKAGGLALLAMAIAVAARPATAAKPKRPRQSGLPKVFLIDAKTLGETKQRLAAGDPALAAAAGRLEREADKALKLGPFSVVTAGKTPPSGDKHDYISLSRYAWPNPDTPNGLPWIVRDGHSNPEGDTDQYSKAAMIAMAKHVETLALAYHLTGRQTYAAHATKLLRAFFLDPATRMNPHLEYAQFVPGKSLGQSTGIIDTRDLVGVVDAVGLLSGSPSWTKADQKGLETWFRAYLGWLVQSKNGQKEAGAENNHGVWYDVQVVSFALFVGQDKIAARVIDEAPARRIAAQIQPDGSQPLELKRTKSLSYCLFNLEALFDLAALGSHVGRDLWTFRTPDGRGMRKALDFMLPYLSGEQKWKHEQITEVDPDKAFPVLRRAATAYHDPRYEQAVAKLPGELAPERSNLLYPPSRR